MRVSWLFFLVVWLHRRAGMKTEQTRIELGATSFDYIIVLEAKTNTKPKNDRIRKQTLPEMTWTEHGEVTKTKSSVDWNLELRYTIVKAQANQKT